MCFKLQIIILKYYIQVYYKKKKFQVGLFLISRVLTSLIALGFFLFLEAMRHEYDMCIRYDTYSIYQYI